MFHPTHNAFFEADTGAFKYELSIKDTGNHKKILNTSYNTPTNLLSYTVKNRDLLYWQTNYQVHWTKNWYTMSVREKKSVVALNILQFVGT